MDEQIKFPLYVQSADKSRVFRLEKDSSCMSVTMEMIIGIMFTPKLPPDQFGELLAARRISEDDFIYILGACLAWQAEFQDLHKGLKPVFLNAVAICDQMVREGIMKDKK